MKKMLPAKLYEQIVENVPLVCVDILLAVDNGVLLVKRKKPPFKGWWLPGGRVSCIPLFAYSASVTSISHH